MRKITKIILHTSATRPSQDIGAKEIRVWHVKDQGWKDIGYHWIIRRNGQLEQGRPERIAGAHVKGHNANSIGVCMVGGIKESNGKPDSNYTLEQWNTLRSLLIDLKGKYPDAEITGHRELDNRACPCFDATVLFYEG